MSAPIQQAESRFWQGQKCEVPAPGHSVFTLSAHGSSLATPSVTCLSLRTSRAASTCPLTAFRARGGTLHPHTDTLCVKRPLRVYHANHNLGCSPKQAGHQQTLLPTLSNKQWLWRTCTERTFDHEAGAAAHHSRGRPLRKSAPSLAKGRFRRTRGTS